MSYSNRYYGWCTFNNTGTVLGSIVIKALNRAGVPADQVDHVYMGCVIQAGLGQNVARQASLKAGLPIETPAVTVNVVCGSGLNCVNMAAQMIQAGDADIVVAGGMENMSMAPYAAMNARFGYRMNNGKLVDTMVNDALWDAFNDYHMIKTADNICEQWGLTREELDAFAANSQQKAAAAQESGAFDAEIVPVMVKKKKETIEFKKDEGLVLEQLLRLWLSFVQSTQADSLQLVTLLVSTMVQQQSLLCLRRRLRSLVLSLWLHSLQVHLQVLILQSWVSDLLLQQRRLWLRQA